MKKFCVNEEAAVECVRCLWVQKGSLRHGGQLAGPVGGPVGPNRGGPPGVCEEATLPHDFPAFLTRSGKKQLYCSSHSETKIKTRLLFSSWTLWLPVLAGPAPLPRPASSHWPGLPPGELPRYWGARACQLSAASPSPAFRLVETHLPVKFCLWISL